MSDPRWPRRIGHPAKPCNLTPAWAGQFSTFTDWLDKAPTWIDARAVCIDAKGRRCVHSYDFMRARDEDAFPVRFFWECEEPDTSPFEAAQARERALRDAVLYFKKEYRRGWPANGMTALDAALAHQPADPVVPQHGADPSHNAACGSQAGDEPDRGTCPHCHEEDALMEVLDDDNTSTGFYVCDTCGREPNTTPLLPWERRWWAAHESRKGSRPPSEDRQILTAHFRDEAGELEEVVVRSEGALGAQGIEGELADCYMLIRALFRHYGLDPDVEAERKLNEVLARPEWAPYDKGEG